MGVPPANWGPTTHHPAEAYWGLAGTEAGRNGQPAGPPGTILLFTYYVHMNPVLRACACQRPHVAN